MVYGVKPYEYTNCEICDCEIKLFSEQHMSFEDNPNYTHICSECYDNMFECEGCGHHFLEKDIIYDEKTGCEYCESCLEEKLIKRGEE